VKSRNRQHQLVRPIAQSAVDGLVSHLPEIKSVLLASARADLAWHLERWLLRILQSALSAKLVAKSPENFSVDLGITPAELGLKGFFEFLPGAKQTVDLIVKDWIRAQEIMLVRLQQDWEPLSLILLRSAKQHIKHIAPGLSDPHERGQTVTILQFSSGHRVVYKPRACDGERIWFSTLRFLNRAGFQPSFQIPKLISRRSYCWMSFVEHRGSESIKAVRRFYFRWGAQAAIAQLLGCTDLHRQTGSLRANTQCSLMPKCSEAVCCGAI
jgi:hypothetical protein